MKELINNIRTCTENDPVKFHNDMSNFKTAKFLHKHVQCERSMTLITEKWVLGVKIGFCRFVGWDNFGHIFYLYLGCVLYIKMHCQ